MIIRRDGYPTRQKVQRIRIQHPRLAAGNHLLEHLLAPGASPDTRATHDNRGSIKQRRQLRAMDQAMNHDGWTSCQGRCHMLGAGRQRHEPGTRSRRSLCRQQTGPTESAITRNHQHMPESSLMGVGRPGW